MGGAKAHSVAFVACVLLARSDLVRSQTVDPPPPPPSDPALLVDDAPTLMDLEAHGYGFRDVVNAKQRATLVRVLEADMAEFTRGLAPDSVRRPFQVRWVTRGRFELTGVVNRFDRRAFDAPGAESCGEVRLVYRLALRNRGRPSTRLPMTVNVRIPQLGDCRTIAQRWLSAGTRSTLESILRTLPSFSKLEINFQSIHVPSNRVDMDDNAEYTLRAFRVDGNDLVPDPLFNTPRTDLSAPERTELKAWLFEHMAEVDDGSAVLPERFLATRAVSVSPRGLLHLQNRPFSQLFGGLPDAHLEGVSMVKTEALLLRRLDELTCPGCHQSRGIAGFHLLGEERDPRQTFNGLAVGHSPHLGAELAWRRAVLRDAAEGRTSKRARPFSMREDGPGRYGAACGLPGSGMEAWTCAGGLLCRDLHGGALGICVPSDVAPGDPCERVRVGTNPRPEGALVTSESSEPSCPVADNPKGNTPFCAPNWLGFTGGMCSQRCPRPGETRSASGGGAGDICTLLPAAGYESDCFYSREPVEECLRRHFVKARVATCDAHSPCRDDYACARVADAPTGTGACAPPYFVFQLRADGPVLDR